MKKFDIWNFVSSESLRPSMQCVHCENGRMIASDCIVLASVTAEYPTEFEGQNLNKYSKLPTTIEDEKRAFPKTETILDGARKGEITSTVDLPGLEYAVKRANVARAAAIGAKPNISIGMPFSDGETRYIKSTCVEILLPALKQFGLKEFRTVSGFGRCIYAGDGQNEFVVMPSSERVPMNYIDVNGNFELGTFAGFEKDYIETDYLANMQPHTDYEQKQVIKAQKQLAKYAKLIALFPALAPAPETTPAEAETEPAQTETAPAEPIAPAEPVEPETSTTTEAEPVENVEPVEEPTTEPTTEPTEAQEPETTPEAEPVDEPTETTEEPTEPVEPTKPAERKTLDEIVDMMDWAETVAICGTTDAGYFGDMRIITRCTMPDIIYENITDSYIASKTESICPGFPWHRAENVEFWAGWSHGVYYAIMTYTGIESAPQAEPTTETETETETETTPQAEPAQAETETTPAETKTGLQLARLMGGRLGAIMTGSIYNEAVNLRFKEIVLSDLPAPYGRFERLPESDRLYSVLQAYYSPEHWARLTGKRIYRYVKGSEYTAVLVYDTDQTPTTPDTPTTPTTPGEVTGRQVEEAGRPVEVTGTQVAPATEDVNRPVESAKEFNGNKRTSMTLDAVRGDTTGLYRLYKKTGSRWAKVAEGDGATVVDELTGLLETSDLAGTDLQVRERTAGVVYSDWVPFPKPEPEPAKEGIFKRIVSSLKSIVLC